jgi:RNase P/RNase MRP subunit p29
VTKKLASIAATALLLAALAIVCAQFVSLPASATTAATTTSTATQTMQYTQATATATSDNTTTSTNVTLPDFHMGSGSMMKGQFRENFGCLGASTEMNLQNATLATVQGTIVTETRNLLILNTTDGQIRIQLPSEWTLGTEIVNANTVFNGTFATTGQTVTLQVIENTVASNASFSVNTMMAYEATNASGTTATAVLPYNIQATS